VRTCRLDEKGEIQGGSPPEDESTDAGHRGGTAGSSEEAPVMGVERRSCVVQGYLLINQNIKCFDLVI
jgi:hypothetical protein